MIPTAGLYLPGTLHREQAPTAEKSETQRSSRKYFERRPKVFDRKSIARKSAESPRKSMDNASTSLSALPTVSEFIDFAISQDEVSSDNKVFVNLIHRVRHDINEASRLRVCPAVTAYCESVPDRETWLDAILLDVKRAYNDIGLYVENVRVSGDDGGVAALKRKFEWVLSHQKKLLTREISLQLCHQSLMAAIQVMQQVELSGGNFNYELEGTTPDPYGEPVRPWLEHEGPGSILRSPHSRQKWRTSQRNLSLPSIMVSEPELDKVKAQSINETPVELPGSTPDDLPDPDNWDLYAPPLKPQQSLDQISPQISLDPLRPRTAVDQDQSQRPLHSAQDRQSFDQVRPHASFDQIRPRAYSAQIRPRPSLEEYKSRASFDRIGPLPILNGKPVGRTESTASVSEAATIPLQAKRYRAQAVNVRRPPPTKHRSLPSETQLPCLPAQSSLIMELSHWVSSESLDAASKSEASSLDLSSSPATSPAIFARPVPSAQSMTTVSAPVTPLMSTNILPAPTTSSPLKYSADSLPRPTSPTIVSADSNANETIPTTSPTISPSQKSPPSSIRSQMSISRKPVPTATIVEEPSQTTTKAVAASSQEASFPQREVDVATASSDNTPTNGAPQTETPSTHGPPSQEAISVAETLELTTDVNSPHTEPSSRSSTLDQSGTSPTSYASTETTSQTQSSAKSSSDPSVPAPQNTSAPTTAIVNVPVANLQRQGTLPPASPSANAPIPTIPIANGPTASVSADVPKPMVAQSKRRAAHARRMQLAYGSG